MVFFQNIEKNKIIKLQHCILDILLLGKRVHVVIARKNKFYLIKTVLLKTSKKEENHKIAILMIRTQRRNAKGDLGRQVRTDRHSSCVGQGWQKHTTERGNMAQCVESR